MKFGEAIIPIDTLNELKTELEKADKLLTFILNQHHDVLNQVIYDDIFEFVERARKRKRELKDAN